MTLPREKLEEIFEPAAREALEPGERIVASVYAIPGPSPMVVGFLGAAVQAARGGGDLWLAVTDRRAIFVRTTFMTQKPKGIAWVDPRHAVQIAEVHADERSGWDWFVYVRPDGTPMRLNVSLVWRDAFDAIVRALQEPPASPHADGWEAV